MFKKCKDCGLSKELAVFDKWGSSRDGHRRSCRECANRVQPKGPDRQLAKEAKRRYYIKNREEVIKRSAKWGDDNKERRNQQALERKAVDPETAKRRARGYALKRKYGITIEQYEELLDRQEHKCAICGRHESEFKTNLAVDHSHRTGRIRGALCTGCNYRLVARHENAELLRRVADYIEQGTEWFVPEKPKRRRKTTRKVKA